MKSWNQYKNPALESTLESTSSRYFGYFSLHSFHLWNWYCKEGDLNQFAVHSVAVHDLGPARKHFGGWGHPFWISNDTTLGFKTLHLFDALTIILCYEWNSSMTFI